MDEFTFVNLFETKGIEYIIIIAFLLLIIPFWVMLTRPVKVRLKRGAGLDERLAPAGAARIGQMVGLDKRGITRLRGTWAEAWGRPAMPMLHPAYLLRSPVHKKETWIDMQRVEQRYRESGV